MHACTPLPILLAIKDEVLIPISIKDLPIPIPAKELLRVPVEELREPCGRRARRPGGGLPRRQESLGRQEGGFYSSTGLGRLCLARWLQISISSLSLAHDMDQPCVNCVKGKKKRSDRHVNVEIEFG